MSDRDDIMNNIFKQWPEAWAKADEAIRKVQRSIFMDPSNPVISPSTSTGLAANDYNHLVTSIRIIRNNGGAVSMATMNILTFSRVIEDANEDDENFEMITQREILQTGLYGTLYNVNLMISSAQPANCIELTTTSGPILLQLP